MHENAKARPALVLKPKCKYLWRTQKLAILIVSLSVYHLIVDVNSRSLFLKHNPKWISVWAMMQTSLWFFFFNHFTRSSYPCSKISTRLTSWSASFPWCSSPCKRLPAVLADSWARSRLFQTQAAGTIFCWSSRCLVSLTRKLSFDNTLSHNSSES